MKKKFLLLTGLSLSLIVPLSLSSSRDEVKAAFNEIADFEDDFNDKEINDNWQKKNASVYGDYSSLRIVPDGQNWEASLIYANYCLKENVSNVEISFEIQQLDENGWLGFAAGLPSTSSTFSAGQFGTVFHSNNTTGYFKFSGEKGLKEDTSTPNSNFSPFYGINNKRIVTFSFRRQNDSTFLLDYLIKDKNGNLIGSKTDFVTLNIDGYFGFNSYSKKSEILSFMIKDDHEQKGVLKTVCEEDFYTSSILYSSSGTVEAHWYANSFAEEDVTCGLIGKADLTKSDSSLTYKTQFESSQNNKLDILYKLSANFILKETSVGASTGFAISKQSIDGDGVFFGVERTSAGYYLVASNGGSTNKELVIFNENNIDLTTNLELDVYFDGKVTLTDGTHSVSGKVNTVNGYFELKTLALANNSMSGAYVDDFSFVIAKYLDRSTPDSGQSFKGTKENEDNYGKYYEFYLSNHDWHIGSHVRIPSYTDSSALEPHVLFSESVLTSAFGPKLKYQDFIARFDVIIQSDIESLTNGASVGLQVGKKTFEVSYANAKSLGIGYYNQTCLPVGTQSEYDVNEASILANPELFEKGTVINFLYVVRNNKIEMHYKTSDQPDSELSEAKMTAECNGTDGYAAVYGVQGLSFKLTKLAITNLDYDLTDSAYNGTDYTETIRHNFTFSENTDGLITSDTSYFNKTLKLLENGSIKTQNKLNANIVRFRVNSIENKLVLKQGNLTLALEDSSSKKIIISSYGESQEIALDNNFAFENSLFELKHAGTKLELRYISGNEPLQKMDNNIISLDKMINVVNEYDEIEIISVNGIASLKELSIFNLDNHITIAARNYDPAIDYFDPWVKRDSANSTKGCRGSLVSTSAITSIATFMAVLLIVSRKRRENYEK